MCSHYEQWSKESMDILETVRQYHLRRDRSVFDLKTNCNVWSHSNPQHSSNRKTSVPVRPFRNFTEPCSRLMLSKMLHVDNKRF